jgi:hypothetical protein
MTYENQTLWVKSKVEDPIQLYVNWVKLLMRTRFS